MDTGERIKRRREELGMSQEELAKKLGYKSRSSINKIELASRTFTQSKIKAFADALDVSPLYILGMEEKTSGEKEPTEGRRINIVRLAGRDGSFLEKKLTDEQIAALKVMISQLPEAEDI